MTAERAFVALRGVFYATWFVMLWWWVAVSVEPFDARLPFHIPLAMRPLGWLIAIPGALLAAWCIFAFITVGRGTPAPFDAPREFVATGPYRYVRNPMYIGGLSVILGAGLMVGSPSIALLSVFFLALTHLFVLLYEEPTLEQRFGQSYRDYKSRVRRWLPGRQK